MSKVIAIFVEGDTEVTFYKKLIKHIRQLHGKQFECNIEYKNLKGIGNFKKDSIKRLNEIKTKYSGDEIFVFLCYDTDVFKFAKKPPVDMNKVKLELLENGATGVEFVEANDSIESWFLLDFSGILTYLGLPKGTKKGTGKGQDILKRLFKSKSRLYVKGNNSSDLVEALDISKIQKGICSAIKPICDQMGLDCKKICSK